MKIYEFELRYRAYEWLKNKLRLDWNQETILQLVKTSDKGQLTKSLPETTPTELKELTLETYTLWKKEFLQKQEEKKIGERFTLREYIERLEYELKVIREMWFDSYFLIVSDFVRRAKKNMIVVGPWRWSWAWSLLARVVSITDIDPLPYDLLFERFLNPARISMPDFDIDFEDTQREKVIEYVKNKYGEENVCGIGTFMQMATKAAFKDAARVVGVDYEKSNKFSSLIPDKTAIKEALNSADGNEELKNLYATDEKVQKAVEYGTKLEGNLRQLGMHACGIIIAPQKVTNYTPAQYVKEWDQTVVSQYDGPTLEAIGLLKMDFLWLRNLSVIKNCIKIIAKRHEKEGKELPEMFKRFFEDTSFQPPLDDEYTFKRVFQSGETTWIFQFESAGMQKNLIDLKPNCMDDLVAMNALYRPWPMEFIPSYIKRKHGKEDIIYMHPELKQILIEKYNEGVADEENMKLIEDLEPIMRRTYGIAAYQEQLMFLSQSMAGFSLSEADNLRKAVGKKKKDLIEKIKKEFVIRAQEHRQYKLETATFIYERLIEPAGSYSFNKSHSVCYSYIAYQTAYLKAHYPVEFYAALIRSVEEDTDELSKYIYETQTQWIKILPPDINESFNHVAAINDTVRLWFFCIKWIGMEIGESIQEERKKWWAYTNLENFLKRCQNVVNKKSIEWLSKSWALDKFSDRKTILENVENIIERAKGSQQSAQWLFWNDEIGSSIKFKTTYTTSFMEKLMMEQEVFKSFVSWHPLDGLYPYLKKRSFISQIALENFAWPFIITWYICDIKRARKKWFFIEVEDVSWKREFFFKDILDFKKFDIIIIHGYKNKWWRMPSIDKIAKISLEALIKKVGSRYDPEMTVVKVKWLRKGSNTEEGEKVFHEDDVPKEEEQKEIPTSNYRFKIPESIQKIQKIAEIIKNYKGDKEVILWEKTIVLNDEWIEQLMKLLHE